MKPPAPASRNPSSSTLTEVAVRLGLAAAVATWLACSQAAAPQGSGDRTATGAESGAIGAASASRPSSVARGAASVASQLDASAEPSAASPVAGQDAARFAELVERLSEPDGDFFSDNYISNETSYLQVADALAQKVPAGRAYIGVGPEQNFTYLALTKPALAFIVDIRRDNLVLHLLYRALFDRAESRAEFLTMLVGRPFEPEGAPGPDATLAQVVAHAERRPADAATFERIHRAVRDRIETGYGVHLDAKDKKSLEVSHRAFFDRQLELRFELHQKNGRRYPTLRELLSAVDPEGKQLGFLAREDEFRTVQRLERDGRVLPVVGDFAGDRALAAVAKTMRDRGLSLGAFYVSNVEQYLLEPAKWAKWIGNVGALPHDEQSVLVRCYLDQGKRHPRQLDGHRTATTLHGIAPFLATQAKKPPPSFFQLASTAML